MTSQKRDFTLYSLEDYDVDTIIQIVREEQNTYDSGVPSKKKRIFLNHTVESIKHGMGYQNSTDEERATPLADSISHDAYSFTSSVKEVGQRCFNDEFEDESDTELHWQGMDEDSSTDESSDISKRTRHRSLDDFRKLRAEFLHQFTRRLCPSRDVAICTVCQERGPSILCLDCFHFRIQCQGCILKEHAYHPLHRLMYFDGYTWQRTSLRNLGLKVHLGHGGNACPSMGSATELKTITVIDIKGVQEVDAFFCVCGKTVGMDAVQRSQLIQHGWYPATTENPRTVATFSTLDIFEALSGEGKLSGYHFYRSLVRLIDGTGCELVPKRYEEFMRMTREYEHLKMLQRAGKTYLSDESFNVEDGELGVECPACPHPGKNIPSDWDKKVDSWIYTLFIMVDANFRLKSKKKRSVGDLDLGEGSSYFIRDEPYKEYLKSAVQEKEIKYCDSGLRAVDHASLKGGRGYDASGVVGVQCRHMLLRKNGVGDLQKGEKYANVDYVVLSSLKNLDLKRVTLSYDINCQYSRNFSKRVLKFDKKMQLDLSKLSLEFVIPQFHITGHGKSCRTMYNLRFREHVGRTDGENIERGWAAFNPLSMASKEMGFGARRDYLNWHIGDWNYQRILSFGHLFPRKLKEAVLESVKHTSAMMEFRKAFPKGMIKEIEDNIKQWNGDRTSLPNPYEDRDHAVSLLKAQRSLIQEEADEEKGMPYLESMSATHWLSVGLELEESQERARKNHKASKNDTATILSTSGVEKSLATLRKIRAWKDRQLFYMPGLTQYENWDSMQDDVKSYGHCWSVDLNLPSSIRAADRVGVCPRALCYKEFKLREAQAQDALDEIRLLVQKLWWLTSKKKQHISGPGQKKITKSNSAILVLIEDRDKCVDRYRRATAALMALEPEGDWRRRFLYLKDEDIRPMEDDEGKGEGRRTLSWIWKAEGAAPLTKEGKDVYEGLKVEYAKSRARASRWLEEVQLLKEEMRRVLCYFNWKMMWWSDSVSHLKGSTDEAALGCIVYCNRQIKILQTMAQKFRNDWVTTCDVQDLPAVQKPPLIAVMEIDRLPSFINVGFNEESKFNEPND